MTPIEMVRRLNKDQQAVHAAVEQAAQPIAEVIAWAAEAIRGDGRLLYVGAGTSGRLGVLDASECPPTFGVSPDRVIGVIAGGDEALRKSIEGAEDDQALGRKAVQDHQVGQADVVVGVAASGTTPFVLAALEEARRHGAKTALLCCNPYAEANADAVIALDTGQEALSGSTRLKAGTATKVVLNMISTGAMASAGYVYQGLMVGVRPVNKKLWKRACRIVAALAKVDPTRADDLLTQSHGAVAAAILMGAKGCSLEAAQARLKKTANRLRNALDDPLS